MTVIHITVYVLEYNSHISLRFEKGRKKNEAFNSQSKKNIRIEGICKGWMDKAIKKQK